MQKRVAIVGAGISGLSAAYSLKKAGWDPILVDSRSRAGGVLETTRQMDCLVEGGPDSYLAQKPWATALIRELGMGDDLIGSNDSQRKTFIIRNGRLVPMPDGLLMMVPTKVMPMVATRLLSWPTKIRMGLELLRSAPAANRVDDVSVADFFRDHYNQEAVDYLAEPLLAGVYGGDPERMSAPSVLGRFVELEREYGSLARGVLAEKRKRAAKASKDATPPAPLFRSLKNGMGSLADKLVSVIGAERFLLSRHVESLERAGRGYRLKIGGDALEAGKVILATPAYGAAALLRGMEPVAAALLDQIPYNSSATVALIYNITQFSQPPVGFGFLVPRRERQTMVAATYVQNKFKHRIPPDKVLVRCFVGKAAEEDAVLRDDVALVAAVKADLRRLTGLAVEPIAHSVFRWPRAMAQYEVGHGQKVAEIRERIGRLSGVFLAGNAYEGIGIPDCIRAGEQAAAACLR
ncbi:MAG: protoporphyrinogen oxidase [Bryobacterales bacterium]|nr:protoporphyrinogen oxidase [Bryobacterales bacterium]